MDHSRSQCTCTLKVLLLKQNRGVYWNEEAYSIGALSNKNKLQINLLEKHKNFSISFGSMKITELGLF